MLSKRSFAQLSKHIQIGKMAHDPLAAAADFGGINVVVCGDGHQFPPVQGGAAGALYRKPEPGDSTEAKLGRDIFKRFTTIVVLRRQWNEAAAAQHCQKEGCQLFIRPANDTIQKRPLTPVELEYVAARANPSGKPGDLPDSVMLVVGMKAMVTLNVETDLDIAKGARGEIVDIVLSPNEPPFDPTAPAVTLQHLPLYILVKLARHTRGINLPGLEAGVVPIVPSSKSFKITLDVQKGGKSRGANGVFSAYSFQSLLRIYAFTDYQSQGQTIESVIVDITIPPAGKRLTLFNIYVALSRSSGTETIRLLRDFDEGVLMQPLDEDLDAE
ncbi:hypothetical protein FRC08_003717, partial [Ceratobasidium sp. 394]